MLPTRSPDQPWGGSPPAPGDSAGAADQACRQGGLGAGAGRPEGAGSAAGTGEDGREPPGTATFSARSLARRPNTRLAPSRAQGLPASLPLPPPAPPQAAETAAAPGLPQGRAGAPGGGGGWGASCSRAGRSRGVPSARRRGAPSTVRTRGGRRSPIRVSGPRGEPADPSRGGGQSGSRRQF